MSETEPAPGLPAPLATAPSPGPEAALVARTKALYAACRLPEPAVLVAPSAVDLVRRVVVVARTWSFGRFGPALNVFYLALMAGLTLIPPARPGREALIDAYALGTATVIPIVCLGMLRASRPPWSRPSWATPLGGYALAGAAGAVLALAAGGGRPVILGSLAALFAAAVHNLVVVAAPFIRRLRPRRGSRLVLPLSDRPPVHDVVEARLTAAAAEVPTLTRPRPPASPPDFRERAEVERRIAAEGERLLAHGWHALRPLLGAGAETYRARHRLYRAATAAGDPDDLPAVLRAALALDAAADAVVLLDGVAVVLPAGAPLEAVVADRPAPFKAWRRSRRPAFAPALAVLGDGGAARLVDLMPTDALAERSIARRIVRLAEPAIRFAAIEAFGPARLTATLKMTPERTDEAGALYAFGPRERPSVYVRVEDATPGPDGTRAEHWLSVPPHVASAREAVAWTFGMAERRYRPTAES